MHDAARKHDKGRAAFTLIELLVVIAIIAILASISVPVVSRAITSARKAQAKTEMAAIETAVRAYYNEYGRYPHGSGQPDIVYDAVNQQELMNVLRSIDGEGNTAHDRNPRRITFLEVADRSLSTDGADAQFVDPWFSEWGNPYFVAVDTDFDGDVETGVFDPVNNRKVAVWSLGVDGEESSAIKSWE